MGIVLEYTYIARYKIEKWVFIKKKQTKNWLWNRYYLNNLTHWFTCTWHNQLVPDWFKISNTKGDKGATESTTFMYLSPGVHM